MFAGSSHRQHVTPLKQVLPSQACDLDLLPLRHQQIGEGERPMHEPPAVGMLQSRLICSSMAKAVVEVQHPC